MHVGDAVHSEVDRLQVELLSSETSDARIGRGIFGSKKRS